MDHDTMTMSQRILARHAGRDRVEAGELVMAEIDLALANDITAPVAIDAFRALGAERVFDPSKVALVPDHFAPNKDLKAAAQCAAMRCFAREKGVENYFEVGHDCGIEHALLPEKGLVPAGSLVVGADSHTCTYGALNAFSTGVGSTDIAFAMAEGKAWFKIPAAIAVCLHGTLPPFVSGKDVILHLIGRIGVDGARYKSLEFGGPGVAALTMDDRFTIANMAIEAGAKNGIFPYDDATRDYLRESGAAPGEPIAPGAGAAYDETIEIDLFALRPLVAFPNLPSNVRPAAEAGDIAVDQVVIGSCTNGRLGDLAAAARILARRKVANPVRCIVIPATQKTWLEADRLGYLRTFVEAGCVVSPPTCGPCLGGHMGILAAGERALATTNRNFTGRMGHPDSEVFLASPAVAAATAVAGRIVSPEQL